MGKWISYAVVALVVIGVAAFAQTERDPVAAVGGNTTPQALIEGGHLLVLNGPVINVYDMNRLPDMELVNAVEVPDSLDEAAAMMTRAHSTRSRAKTTSKDGPAQTVTTSTTTEQGRKIYDSLGCANCHRISGKGGTVGPDLTHEGSHHDQAWIEKKVTDPKATKKNSIMPAHQMAQKDLEALGKYLAGLK